MTVFFTARDMYDVFVPYCRSLALDRDIGPHFVATGTCARLTTTGPDGVLVIDARRDPAFLVSGKATQHARPDIEFCVPADDIHSFWLGRCDLLLALHQQDVSLRGPRAKLAELLRVFRLADGRYLTHLYSTGRQHLT
jgi:hypothetical protein